jgi:hypothetical protein
LCLSFPQASRQATTPIRLVRGTPLEKKQPVRGALRALRARAWKEACSVPRRKLSSWVPDGSSTTTSVRSRNLAVAFAGLLVSCGSGDALAPEAGNLVADLRVTVKPEGPGGPERVRRVECAVLGQDAIDPRCRVLWGLEPRDLEPVPRRTACAQVYGGPGTARVRGDLRGVRVSADFDLTDACEIARWRRNAALVGAPGVGHGAP